MHSMTEKRPNFFQMTGMAFFFDKADATAVSNDLKVNDDEMLAHAKTEHNAQKLNDNRKPVTENSSNFDSDKLLDTKKSLRTVKKE